MTTNYTAREVAKLLDHSIDWFYEHRARLIAEGMPGPIVPFGRLKFDRRSIDAWLGRHHPHAPPRAANGTMELRVPQTDEEWRQVWAMAHGQGT